MFSIGHNFFKGAKVHKKFREVALVKKNIYSTFCIFAKQKVYDFDACNPQSNILLR